MDRNSSQQINRLEDEIDLTQVALKVINAFQRSLKIFIIIVVAGAIIGGIHRLIAKPVYRTSMIASSKILTLPRIERLTEVLNKLALEKNSVLLAQKLHISTQLASSIHEIKAQGILDEENKVEKEDQDSNVFEITISMGDNHHLDSLQSGILYYIQNNNFVEKRTAIRRQNLKVMQSRILDEVKKLDSLRFSVNRMISKGVGNNSTMLMTDPASVNKDIIALYERELNIQSELQLVEDIQVIQDFTQFERPISPKLTSSVAASTASAIILGIILIFILEARRGMNRLKTEFQQKEDKELV